MVIDGLKMMSKTQHYRKVTKPLLERKRRARMNLYLDELKDLIVETMEEKGEHITKLEKADILEMTVTFLKGRNDAASAESTKSEKFRAGYTQAAYEVSRVFASIPGIDVKFGTNLMKHLGYKLKEVDTSKGRGHASPSQSPGLTTSSVPISPERVQKSAATPEAVWRPW